MFKKNKEDFVCEKCGERMVGNGYTNHCSACLWSKHVDIDPGDRLSKCTGLMEPIKIEGEGDNQKIVHKCIFCGYIKTNKISRDDNFNSILQIVKNFADKI